MFRASDAFAMLLAMAGLATAQQAPPSAPPRAAVWVGPGAGHVGCVAADPDCYPSEKPGRTVTLSQGFWLDATEVTVGEYRAFVVATGRPTAPTPPFRQGEDAPVVNVTWQDAADYCAWAGKRLPSEAEWEIAARGGHPDWIFPTGMTVGSGEANAEGTGVGDRWERTAPVASFAANPYGLFDMAGNVWEWTADWFDPTGRGVSSTDRDTPPPGALKVIKGGAWNSSPKSLRVSNRGRFPAASYRDTLGFRCARDGGAPTAGTEPAAPTTPAVDGGSAPAAEDLGDGRGAAAEPPTAVATASDTAVRTPEGTARGTGSSRVAAGTLRRFPPALGEWAWVPPGTFEMGCVLGDGSCFADEQPRHPVTLTRGFWVTTTEVTVGAYQAFVAAAGHPSPDLPSWATEGHPVVSVTWDDAAAYCAWAGGRLPTEAEWECAARGGRAGERYPWGDAVTHDEANYDGTDGADVWPKSAPVASFGANALGLYDTAGNVWEWCGDWYAERAYTRDAVVDPSGPAEGVRRVVRGGSWTSDPGRVRSSYRFSLEPSSTNLSVGFRCVREAAP